MVRLDWFIWWDVILLSWTLSSGFTSERWRMARRWDENVKNRSLLAVNRRMSLHQINPTLFLTDTVTLLHCIKKGIVIISLYHSVMFRQIFCSTLWVSPYCHKRPRHTCCGDDHLMFILSVQWKRTVSVYQRGQRKLVALNWISQTWQWFPPGWESHGPTLMNARKPKRD